MEGVGGSLSVFSINQYAKHLIQHEMAHSVAMFADEYSYFSDEEKKANCNNYGHIYGISDISEKTRWWGGNQFFGKDKYLAPNVTLFDDFQKAKWSHWLTESSPIVYFDYPLSKPMWIAESRSLSLTYIARKSRDEFLLTMGTSPEINRLIKNIKSVSINGIKYNFQIEKPGEAYFLRIKEFAIKENARINVTIKFKHDSELRHIKNDHLSRHIVSLPNRTFQATEDEVGLFQGTAVDMVKTFRPSFNSIMSSYGGHFNPVQLEAYRKQIESYIEVSLNNRSNTVNE